MMAVTICEKACGYNAGHGAESAKKGDILAMLSKLGEKEDKTEGEKAREEEHERVKEIVGALLGRLGS
jgi:hypothetical protein